MKVPSQSMRHLFCGPVSVSTVCLATSNLCKKGNLFIESTFMIMIMIMIAVYCKVSYIFINSDVQQLNATLLHV